MVQILSPPSALPPPLSLFSYNVLLPNSQDGWWTYKMYLPPVTDPQIASWEYRRDLIAERIRQADPTIVCFQEVAPDSFAQDFAFMATDLGFDGQELFKKGRFRPATFWKTEAVRLVAPPVHKDRTLLTAFARPDEQRRNNNHYWYVLNCHLQAGPQAPRRVRQIHEGVRSVLTLARKLKEPNPQNIPLLVCGDFNGGSECGAVRYLEDGLVDHTFLEDGKPVTSSEKRYPLAQPLYDVMATGRTAAPPPPPTMVVSELISLLMAPHSSASGQGPATAWENPRLNDAMRTRLQRIFGRLATGQAADDGTAVMTVADVEKWLTTINGQVGRGDEFRQAARQMGWTSEDPSDARITALPAGGVLTWPGFVAVYEAELRSGKFWGIAHDMAVLGEPLPVTELYTARYDRLYASAAVETTAVMDFVAHESCPNAQEPSDHLPVAASFRLPCEGI